MTGPAEEGPSDSTSSPEAIIEEAYRLIGFAPGGDPRWDAFRALFDPRAVLALRVFPGDNSITVMNLDEYVVHQIREGMKDEGYAEIPGETEWFRFGDIAEARVRFGMKFGEAEPVPALNVFQLVRRNGRWWIASIVSDMPGA